MDTNFNEKKAFEDLQAILNHIYAIANKFYGELQTAQETNREKDKIIDDLKREHAEALDKLTKSFEDELDSRREEITELTNKLTEQEKIFATHLKEYGDYNIKLTERLKKAEEELNSRKRSLDKREENLSSREQNLTDDRKTFEEERSKFRIEKISTQKKLDDYKTLQEQANNFDNEKQRLKDTYKDEIATLKKQNQDAQETIKQLEKEKHDLEDDVQNYKTQIKLLNQRS